MCWLQVLNGANLHILSRHKCIWLLIILYGLKSLKSLLHIFIDQQAYCHDVLILTGLDKLEQLVLHLLQRFE